MGQKDGFLIFDRELPTERSPKERIGDYQEIYNEFPETKIRDQAARCMDCGVPFCHKGCPLGNNIPEFNDAVYQGDWQLAIEVLLETNNFPEFTGRICPAPCEGSCVLGINKPQVTIELIEKTIAEKAFELGYIKAEPPAVRSGRSVAVVGSGPAGLAAADELNKMGHQVTVFERDDRPGGLLRYGIPDFKLEKWVVDRRVDLMLEEGIEFRLNTNVGVDVNAVELLENYDALVLCGGSTVPRDLPITGRDGEGIYFAMDFLTRQNKVVSGDDPEDVGLINARGKHVMVIGGGDTGSDCVGTSNRHGAASVTQLELLPKPPESRAEKNPWPEWPMILRTSSSHEEGCEREWAVLTEEFVRDGKGKLKGLKLCNIEWKETGFEKIPGTERELPCEMVLLAMGFIHPQWEGMLEQLELKADERNNVASTNYRAGEGKVFCAGDMRRGQSLVVWAIAEGRQAAGEVDKFLMSEA